MNSPDERLVDVTVYYLEMHDWARRDVKPPRSGLVVQHSVNPTVGYYRFLYNNVGADYHWLSRRKMTDDELRQVIQDPLDELHVLFVDGTPAGFAELDLHQSDEIELVQFGLMADWIGQGIGTWFLQRTIDYVRERQPSRFWLHTCTLDHPAAVPTYKKAGFTQYKEDKIRREL